MKSDLRQALLEMDHKPYKAYKALTGAYQFDCYLLTIDHVQGDPFASPSKLNVRVTRKVAGFPEEYFSKPYTKIALQDYLIRQFYKEIEQYCFKAKGSGKSGMISVSHCGQEVLERTACEITKDEIIVRFEVGFPANGRTINAKELEKILFHFLPKCVEKALLYQNRPAREVEEVIFLAEDQHVIREELKKRKLVAFVANGSILPRESGVSSRPLKEGIPFSSPATMEVVLTLPHKGKVTGMGIKKGITLIAGGGYHGKSTLLKALESGVYNHIAGDGREYVITEETALKIRAEDGRKITDVDISLFINHLPNEKDTHHFSTLDASGSTSQAANMIEGMEAGSSLFLIDEDTSATNLMIRDELMQQVITRNKEPITPFLERAQDLFQKAGISTILVVGSCGAYFHIADTILQMDHYRPVDITESTRDILAQYPSFGFSTLDFSLPNRERKISLQASVNRRKTYRGDNIVTERLKVKVLSKDTFLIGKDTLDLRYVEQLVDREQTATLGYLLRYAKEHFKEQNLSLKEIIKRLVEQIEQNGLSFICDSSYVFSGLAMPRIQEIYACFNRY